MEMEVKGEHLDVLIFIILNLFHSGTTEKETGCGHADSKFSWKQR